MSQLDDLARELKSKYEGASTSEKVVQIHLFGIRRADALRNVSLPDLLARAGMPDSYKTELRKGIRLADHVQVKP
jgi:5-methylcytosine-specific restriction protein B